MGFSLPGSVYSPTRVSTRPISCGPGGLRRLYLIVGRFFWDAYIRGKTFYALTDDDRAIIRRIGFGAATIVIDIAHLPQVTFQSGANGMGTIYFGPQPGLWDGPFASSWNGRRDWVLRFQSIQNAASVFELCKKTR